MCGALVQSGRLFGLLPGAPREEEEHDCPVCQFPGPGAAAAAAGAATPPPRRNSLRHSACRSMIVSGFSGTNVPKVPLVASRSSQSRGATGPVLRRVV